MSHRHAKHAILAVLCLSMSATSAAKAEAPFVDVDKQAPITVLINASPWYKGFEKVVELYDDQTGNVVNLEVTPFDGMLEKARSAVRNGGTSPLDLASAYSTMKIAALVSGVRSNRSSFCRSSL